MTDFDRGFVAGVSVVLMVLVFGLTASRVLIEMDVVTDAKVKAERPAPVFEPQVFDPSRAPRPKCPEQWIAERGPNQEWSTVCIDFRRE